MSADAVNAMLYDIFVATLSSDKNIRESAEQALSDLSSQHADLVLRLMRFACERLPDDNNNNNAGSSSVQHRHVQLAAAIRVRNVIGRSDWNRKPYFTDAVKEEVRQVIVPLQCLPHVSEHVRRQLLATTSELIEFDYPEGWPALIPLLNRLIDDWVTALKGALASGTADQVNDTLMQLKAGLSVLRYCCKVYDNPLKVDAADVDNFAAMFIPSFVTLSEMFHTLWAQELQKALHNEQQLLADAPPTRSSVNGGTYLDCSPTVTELSHCMRLMLKSMWSFFSNRWPKCLCQDETFHPFWLTCIAQPMRTAQLVILPLCQLRIQRQNRSPAFLDLSDHFPVFQESAVWRLMKWCYTIAYKLLQEFMSPKSCEKRARTVATTFKQTYMNEVTLCALQLVRWHSNMPGMMLSSKAYIMALEILTHAVNDKGLYTTVLHPSAEELMTGLLFPRLAFSPEDAELWDQNPEEYVRKQTSPAGDLFSAKVVAGSCLLSLAVPARKFQDDTLLSSLVNFLMNTLQTYSELASQATSYDEASTSPQVLEAARRVDAAMFCMYQFKKVLLSMNLGDDKLEYVLTTFVVPATRYPLCFLRARAVLVLSVFAPSIEWSSPQAYQFALQSVLPLLNDPETPVRVQTCVSFSRLTRHPHARDVVTPCIAELIQHYFQVMRLMDNEAVVRTLRKTISYYHDTLSQWGLALADMIVGHFGTVLQNVTGKYDALERMSASEMTSPADCLDDDGFADTLMAADELLETLTTLVKALPDTTATRDSPPDVLEADVFVRLQHSIAPMLFVILSHQGGSSYGFMDPALNLFTTLVARSPVVASPTWRLLPCLRQLVLRGAVDYFGQMLAPLDNMVSVSPLPFLFASLGSLCDVPAFAAELREATPLQIVDGMCDAVLQSEALRNREVAAVPKIYESVLQNYWMVSTTCADSSQIPSASSVVTPIAQRILYAAGTRRKQNNTLRVLFANALFSCMLANTNATLEVMANLNAITSFYQQYVYLVSQKEVSSLLRTYDRNVFVISFCQAVGELLPLGGAAGATGSWTASHSTLQDVLVSVVDSGILRAYALSEKKCCETEIAYHERRLRKKQNHSARNADSAGVQAEDDDDDDEWSDGDSDSSDGDDCFDCGEDDASEEEDWGDDDDEIDMDGDGLDNEIRAVAQRAAMMRDKQRSSEGNNGDGFDDDEDDDNLLDDEDDNFSSPVDAVNVWAVLEAEVMCHPNAGACHVVTRLAQENTNNNNIFADIKNVVARLMAVRAEVAGL